MHTLPESRPLARVPRVRLQGSNPTVLRLQNGQNIGGRLQVVSLTGGLLYLPHPVIQGSQARMIFLTGTGAVLGGVEMLPAVSDQLQPFRFVSLGADDHRRLGALIGQQANKPDLQSDWVEKLRAASARHNKPRRWRLGVGVFGLLAVGLATAAYVLHFGLLK